MARTLHGRACKLYRNTAVLNGMPNETAPTWSEVGIVGDATLSLSGQTADITVRKHGMFNREEIVAHEVSIEFDIKVPADKLSSADYVAFRDAYISGNAIELALTNAAITADGTEAFRCVCVIADLSEEQTLGDAVKISMTAKATDSANPPRYETISAP